jgi:cytochrome c oxidase cbb3-type subunit 4
MSPTFESATAFAASWGLAYFVVLFIGAMAYALWPSKREEFDHAARIPLTEE